MPATSSSHVVDIAWRSPAKRQRMPWPYEAARAMADRGRSVGEQNDCDCGNLVDVTDASVTVIGYITKT